MVPPACIGLGRNSLEFFYSRNKIPIMFSQIEVSGLQKKYIKKKIEVSGYQPIYKTKIKQDYIGGINALLYLYFELISILILIFLLYYFECVFGFKLKSQFILLFNLFLLLFIDLTVLFQLIFTFIYNTFNKKFSISAK